MKQNVSVVILAAGLGTRMKSQKAKVLHMAGGDTLLNHVIRAALSVAGPEQIAVVVGYQAELVRRSVTAAGIRFAEQPTQEGTGHAVLCARSALTQESGQLLVLNGDGPLLKAGTLEKLLGLQSRGNLGSCVVTTEVADPTGYGRVVRDTAGLISAIVEQKGATEEILKIREINAGLYCFDASPFWSFIEELKPNNPAGEYYLTDMISILRSHGHAAAPLLVEDQTELLGINTRIELAVADRILRTRKTQELMLAGVTIESPETVTVDMHVDVGQDSVIEANVQLRGHTQIGAKCRIGTGSVLTSCKVEDQVTIFPYVVAESSKIGSHSFVGPFSRVRMNTEAAEGTHIGNFVELKKTRLGKGSKANHLAYLGDAEIGEQVNIGAGTITCNYDGENKHPTFLGDGVFVGSNSTLVAPLQIEPGAYIAAGSVITKKVSADALAIGRAHQLEKAGWAKRKRQARQKP